MKKRVTMADVAEEAGVSKSTVSAVINNKDIVKASTRGRVLRAVTALDYRPRSSTRPSVRGTAGRSIGVVVKESGTPHCAEALAGIRDVADEADYLVFASSSDGEFEKEKQIVRQCRAHDFGGLIIAPVVSDESDLAHIFELKRQNVPFILLEQVRGVAAGVVEIDNRIASCLAVKYLIESGHTRIIHMAGPGGSEHSQERIEGVQHAFSESRLAFDDDVVVHTGDTIDDGYRMGLECFVGGSELPTGVTCYNNMVAFGLLKALQELDLKVPDDVSVIGFEDGDALDYFPQPLTTVHMPGYEMGKRAAQLLLEEIEKRTTCSQIKVSLEADLVVRDTVAPPRKSAAVGRAA